MPSLLHPTCPPSPLPKNPFSPRLLQPFLAVPVCSPTAARLPGLGHASHQPWPSAHVTADSSVLPRAAARHLAKLCPSLRWLFTPQTGCKDVSALCDLNTHGVQSVAEQGYLARLPCPGCSGTLGLRHSWGFPAQTRLNTSEQRQRCVSHVPCMPRWTRSCPAPPPQTHHLFPACECPAGLDA